MLTYFRPRIKDQGAHIIRLGTGNIGTITANTTTIFGVGAISDKDDTASAPGHTAYVDEAIVACTTVPVDADGTYLLNLFKYDSSATAAVQLVTSFNMEGLTAGKADRVPLDSGVTDQQRILDFGDYLYISLVNNSAAIDTQMVGGTVNVYIKLLT